MSETEAEKHEKNRIDIAILRLELVFCLTVIAIAALMIASIFGI